jgi:hypothetical protein
LAETGQSAKIFELAQSKHTVWGVPNLREDFQDFFWDLLRTEKDLIVGENSEGNGLSLVEIMDDLRDESETEIQGRQGTQDGHISPGGGSSQEKGWRVYASEERRWRTLTGHGPDPKRVSFPSFFTFPSASCSLANEYLLMECHRSLMLFSNALKLLRNIVNKALSSQN